MQSKMLGDANGPARLSAPLRRGDRRGVRRDHADDAARPRLRALRLSRKRLGGQALHGGHRARLHHDDCARWSRRTSSRSITASGRSATEWPRRPKSSHALRQASWALTVPFVVIFGLRYGIFTPTEAGAVIATYSLAVGLFVYRELKISQLWEVITEAALATATVMMIISAANALGYYMTLEQIASHVGFDADGDHDEPALDAGGHQCVPSLHRHGAGERGDADPADADPGADREAGRHRSGASRRPDLSRTSRSAPFIRRSARSCSSPAACSTCRSRTIRWRSCRFFAVQLAVLALLILFPPLVLTLPNWAFGPGQ